MITLLLLLALLLFTGAGLIITSLQRYSEPLRLSRRGDIKRALPACLPPVSPGDTEMGSRAETGLWCCNSL